MIKIAIVNDTVIAIEALRRILTPNPNYNILWVAKTGAQAIEQCQIAKPDLILMDMHMPNLNGVEATRTIMQKSSCPILIVTATITGNSSQVFEAMGHGALDVVKTPVLGSTTDQSAQMLLRKIDTISKLVKCPKKQTRNHTSNQSIDARISKPKKSSLIVIGASTGGPNALHTILSRLPNNFQSAVVIIQHIDEQFAPGLVHWLGQSSKLPIKVAQNGDYPEPGTVLVAGSCDHLIMRPNRSLRYTRKPTDHVHRPSVDVFFESVATHWPYAGTAMLLTGMGKDGAMGMGKLLSAGWLTIAESEASCIVFGMPKAAIATGAAQKIWSLAEITSHLSNAIQ